MASRPGIAATGQRVVCILLVLSFPVLGSLLKYSYVSPGVRLGYTFGKGLTLNVKGSLGAHANVPFRYFANVTVGHQFRFYSEPERNLFFVEPQAGLITETNLIPGFGAGLDVNDSPGRIRVTPRLSVFCGFVGFVSMELTSISDSSARANIGLQVVTPVPLYEIDMGGGPHNHSYPDPQLSDIGKPCHIRSGDAPKTWTP